MEKKRVKLSMSRGNFSEVSTSTPIKGGGSVVILTTSSPKGMRRVFLSGTTRDIMEHGRVHIHSNPVAALNRVPKLRTNPIARQMILQSHKGAIMASRRKIRGLKVIKRIGRRK